MQIEQVWSPIPNSSQELALDSRAQQTLYCGTRGPGKTDVQLMKFRRRVGVGYGSFWRGIILDREYKNLEDLILKSRKWFSEFDDGAKFLSSHSALKWVWPTGEELLFRVARDVSDYDKYHGHEYSFIGWNELTKYPTDELYDMMLSVNRTSFRPKDHPIIIDGELLDMENIQQQVTQDHPNARKIILPEMPLEVFSTTNPYGLGHSWVKKRFINPAPFGVVVRKKTEVYNPRTKTNEEVEITQVAIHGSWKENIYLTPQYIALLKNEKNKNRRKAWYSGSWDIIAGGALSDLWSTSVHIVPRFVIPETWYVDRGFDWGSTQPFYVGWYAVANGEEACIIVGKKEYKFCPSPGSIVLFHEWYGTEEIGSNKGLEMSARDIARGILRKESALILNRWISDKPKPGPADNSIRDVKESDVNSIEKKMKKAGILWSKSDKSPGSRINGLQLMRDYLQASVDGEGPGFYVMAHCNATTETLPLLPRCKKNPDDVDTKSEDHPYDTHRYRILAEGKQKPPSNLKFRLN